MNIYSEIVKLIALRSTCAKKKVGAIIIDNGNIVASGFNNSIGHNCTNHFEEIFKKTIHESIHYKKQIFDGWFKHWITTGEGRELHREWSKTNEIHAEQMCLNNWNNKSKSAMMFITLEPCIECAKAIVLNKIKYVYYLKEFKNGSGVELLNNAGIIAECIGENNG